MKKTKISTVVLSISLICISLYAEAGIIPRNDLSIPVQRTKNSEMISESDFYKVIKILETLYASKIHEKGGVQLAMRADWNDPTVNAYATREIDTWSVRVSGGIARAPGINKDALALIVCHEIGHHLGGAPRTFLYDGWPSSEGQADYWASSKCLKEYYKVLQDEEVPIDVDIPEKVVNDCTAIYSNYSESKICIRSMLASISFARFLNALPDVRNPISIDSKDTREVKGTNTNDYPRPQCRFDTLYQGSLCTIASDVATSETDAKIGNCNDTSKPGTRPRCWYKP